MTHFQMQHDNEVNSASWNTAVTSIDAQDELHLDTAWDWLRQSRLRAPSNADIWDLRARWSSYRTDFLRQLRTGTYRLTPMYIVGRESQAMWSAEDALALKWVKLGLEGHIPLHEKCEHVKGHSSGTSVSRLASTLTGQGYQWVCRTDIQGYYAQIDKVRLLTQLQQHITRPAYLSLLTQYVHYSVEDAGEFHTPKKEIPRGCALSLLKGALHLWSVDVYFAGQPNTHYVRYMDDFVILSKRRWQIRKQVKSLNQFLEQMGFIQNPDKTFIGRVKKGVDWLGAWLTRVGVTGIAPRVLANHSEKVRRLYERIRHWTKERQVARVSQYRNRWLKWAWALTLLPILPTWAATYAPPAVRGETLIPLGSVNVNLVLPPESAVGSIDFGGRLSQSPIWGGIDSGTVGVFPPRGALGGYNGFVIPGCSVCLLIIEGAPDLDTWARVFEEPPPGPGYRGEVGGFYITRTGGVTWRSIRSTRTINGLYQVPNTSQLVTGSKTIAQNGNRAYWRGAAVPNRSINGTYNLFIYAPLTISGEFTLPRIRFVQGLLWRAGAYGSFEVVPNATTVLVPNRVTTCSPSHSPAAIQLTPGSVARSTITWGCQGLEPESLRVTMSSGYGTPDKLGSYMPSKTGGGQNPGDGPVLYGTISPTAPVCGGNWGSNNTLRWDDSSTDTGVVSPNAATTQLSWVACQSATTPPGEYELVGTMKFEYK